MFSTRFQTNFSRSVTPSRTTAGISVVPARLDASRRRFPKDRVIAAITLRRNEDRLQDSVLPDRRGQLVDRGLVVALTAIAGLGTGIHEVHRKVGNRLGRVPGPLDLSRYLPEFAAAEPALVRQRLKRCA